MRGVPLTTPTAIILTALFGNKPYFAGRTFGFQGDSRRHMFMACALQAAIPKDRPVRILEVGSWVGSSALTWAQAIPPLLTARRRHHLRRCLGALYRRRRSGQGRGLFRVRGALQN